MSPGQAKQILETLANGTHPETGEQLGGKSPFNCLPVIRALFYAVRELERVEKTARGRQPRNAGRSWTDEEDVSLLEAYEEGLSIKELAKSHGRTKGAIHARLLRHGRLQIPDVVES